MLTKAFAETAGLGNNSWSLGCGESSVVGTPGKGRQMALDKVDPFLDSSWLDVASP